MTVLSEAILHNTRGITLVLHDPLLVQRLRPYADFFVLDCAARPCSAEIVASLMMAAGDTPFLIRPQDTQAATLQGLLNLGIDGFVLPDIPHAAALEKTLAACLYPPEGNRPFRPSVMGEATPSLETLNDQITFIVEITTPQLVSQLEHVVEITGVNGLLVSPERLAVAMEKGFEPSHPAVLQTIETISRITARYEMPLGIEGSMDTGFQPEFILAARDADLFNAGLAKLGIKQEPEPEVMDMKSYPVFLTATRE